MSTKYNVLFIMTDQHRKDALGCYHNPVIRTPHIDQLSQGGMTFERAYCENPICMPSRITILTGKKACHHGATINEVNIRQNERTIATVLANAGYKTQCIGKMHLTSLKHRGREESIADWRDGMYQNWKGPYCGFEEVDLILGHSNSLFGHYGSWLVKNHPKHYAAFKLQNMERLDVEEEEQIYANRIPEELHSSTYVGNQAIQFLDRARNGSQPFFCQVSFPDPHWPIIIPEEFYEMYDDCEMPSQIPYNREAEKENYPKNFREVRAGRKIGYNGGPHYIKNVDDIPKIMRKYYGSVSLVDKNLGRILNAIREFGLEKNTIVIYTTDHGELMGSHGLINKGGFLWEHLINVPFIVRCPGLIQAGARTDALFSHIDIVPTLSDLLGIDCNLSVDGISQSDILKGSQTHLRECLTVSHFARRPGWPDIHSLITPEWKLNYYAGDPNGELYHLKNDTHELENHYHDPHDHEIQSKLTFQLLDELILSQNKEAIRESRAPKAGPYEKLVMDYEVWKKEFDVLEKITGLK